MRTVTLSGVLVLLLLFMAGCSPEKQGPRPVDEPDKKETAAKTEKETGGETGEKTGDSQPPKKEAADDPQSTPAESKPADADVAAAIKALIPEASAMAREDFEKLARSPTGPRGSDLKDKSLTLMLFALRPKDGADAKEQFQFQGEGVAKASDIAREIYRMGLRIGKVQLLKGPVTFIHADRITDFTCDVKGDAARGTVSFKVPDLYQGKVGYLARRKDGQWRIEEFIVPAYDIHVRRSEEGTWEKAAGQGRPGAAGPGVEAIDLHLTAKKTVRLGKDEVPLDEANGLLYAPSRALRKLGRRPGAVPVRIAVDDDATYGDCKRLIQACQENRFERFVLQLGGDSYPFDFPLAAPSKGLPGPNELPPMRLRLKAGEEGQIGHIRLNERAFRRLGDVHVYIIGILGDKRGPGSFADSAELELECDDALKFKYVAEACQAVSWRVDQSRKRVRLIKTVWPFGNPHGVEELEEFEENEFEPIEVVPNAVELEEVEDESDVPIERIEVELSPLKPTPRDKPAPKGPIVVEITEMAIDPSASKIGAYQSPLSVRKADRRAELVRKFGGSIKSESAITAALKWLAHHQLADGGWSFDQRLGPCQGRCPNHGTMKEARNAATAMVLLPFLAAGQTHKEGKYKTTVKAGLRYLVSKIKVDSTAKTGTLEEPGGRMYSHGLCTIALCEAYAMTHDKALAKPAQMAIDHIAYAQDPVGGGWRYTAKQAGDTSVTGWQLMGLKTGHMAYLKVNPNTVRLTSKFLDSVQEDEGAQYGYTAPAKGRGATTAIGLLCRMYLGWKKDNPALKRGVEFLDKMGPSKTNLYYNYHATQVMFHYGGEPWQRWNGKMRDQLIETQAKKGHATGSWHVVGDDHGVPIGGRLYCTSLATLNLEVYYRYLSIYREAKKEESK